MSRPSRAGRPQRRHGSGSVRRLRSGRFQALLIGPDGVRRPAPSTFAHRDEAEGWLAARVREVELGVWEADPAPEAVASPLLADYAREWLSAHPVAETTRDLYRRSLESHVLPALGSLRLEQVTPGQVRSWWRDMAWKGPRARSGAYQRLRQVMGHAVEAGLVEANPCRLRGAGDSGPSRELEIATPAEVAAMWRAMPPRARLAVTLASLAGLRSGELRELRRRDVDLDGALLRVDRAVRRRGSEYSVALPKGGKTRVVPLPAQLLPEIAAHLAAHAAPGPDGLLFPSPVDLTEHVREQTFNNWWIKARTAAGRPAFRLHDLRHTALTWHQMAGATLKETMVLAGHSTAEVAMRYQHAARSRLRELADKMPAVPLDAPDV